MNNCILVQYNPLEMIVGRFAVCKKTDLKFIDEFTEECKAFDPFCSYIVIVLDNWDMATPNEIRNACIKTMRGIYGTDN